MTKLTGLLLVAHTKLAYHNAMRFRFRKYINMLCLYWTLSSARFGTSATITDLSFKLNPPGIETELRIDVLDERIPSRLPPTSGSRTGSITIVATDTKTNMKCTAVVNDADVLFTPSGCGLPEPQRQKALQIMNTSPFDMILEDPELCKDVPQELIEVCKEGDVLLVCKDNKAVQCHSQILTMASRLLHGVFENVETASNINSQACHLTSVKRVIHMQGDDAQDWLMALLYLYPLGLPLPELTHQTAKAVAVLGHKYNIPHLTKVAKQFTDNIQEEDSNVGYFRYVFKGWAKLSDSAPMGPTYSEQFKTGRCVWKLSIQKTHEHGKDSLGLYLHYVEPPVLPESHVQFRLAVVNLEDPGNITVVGFVGRNEIAEFQASWSSGLGFRKLVEMSKLQSDGFMVDSSPEVVAVVKVLETTEHDNRKLSTDPEDDMYVFKWLDLARMVHDEELQKKCTRYVKGNVLYSLFDKQFKADMARSLMSIDPDSLVSVMYGLYKFVR